MAEPPSPRARSWPGTKSCSGPIPYAKTWTRLHVIDKQDREVDYLGITTMNYPGRIAPLAKDWLKASHRKLDTTRTPRPPKHTPLRHGQCPALPAAQPKAEKACSSLSFCACRTALQSSACRA